MTDFEYNKLDHPSLQEPDELWHQYEREARNDELVEAPTAESVNDICNATTWKHSRLSMVFEYVDDLSPAQFLCLLGMQWPNFHHVRVHVEELRQMFSCASPVELDGMMNPQERAIQARLPDEFLAYRGAYLENADGLNWYLNREPASEIPLLPSNRIEASPFLVTARVRREDCVVKLEDGLLTVVAWKVEIQRREMLPRTGH